MNRPKQLKAEHAGISSDREIRDAAEFAAAVYQPGLRVLLATLGRDDVQRELVKVGALRAIESAA